MSLKRKLANLMGWEAPLTTIDAGHTAPPFSLKSLDGKEYSLSQLLEKGPVVAAFFKVSCPVCQFTLPFIQRLADRYSGDNATILTISQDDAKSTASFNKEYGMKLLTLLDDPKDYQASNAYGLSMVPTIFLIEPDGKVKVSCMGFGKADLEQIAAELSTRKKIAASFFRADEVIPATKPG